MFWENIGVVVKGGVWGVFGLLDKIELWSECGGVVDGVVVVVVEGLVKKFVVFGFLIC